MDGILRGYVEFKWITLLFVFFFSFFDNFYIVEHISKMLSGQLRIEKATSMLQ